MSHRRVMIVRHGEKPPEGGGPPFGCDADGSPSPDSLSPRGWQRAGALAHLFADPRAPLARPAAVLAGGSTARFPSRRNVQTAGPLAAVLGLRVDSRFAPDDVEGAAAALLALSGPALVVWRHRNVADLVAALTGDATLAPQWDHDRFDMVLVVEQPAAGWRLTQVPQMLLSGDSKVPLGRRPNRG